MNTCKILADNQDNRVNLMSMEAKTRGEISVEWVGQVNKKLIQQSVWEKNKQTNQKKTKNNEMFLTSGSSIIIAAQL